MLEYHSVHLRQQQLLIWSRRQNWANSDPATWLPAVLEPDKFRGRYLVDFEFAHQEETESEREEFALSVVLPSDSDEAGVHAGADVLVPE